MWCTTRIHSRSTSFFYLLINKSNKNKMYNYICNVSPLLFKILFADNTCVLLSGKNLNTLIDHMKTEFISLNNWFKAKSTNFHVTQKNHFVRFLCKFPVNLRAIFLRNDFIIVRLSHLKNPAKTCESQSCV